MNKILMITSSLLLSLAACAGSDSSAMSESEDMQNRARATSQKYKVTFVSNWNAGDHVSLPGNAHFSPIVAATHSSDYDLLPIGGITNSNLEPVAELGDTSKINPELKSAMNSGAVHETLNTTNMFLNQSTEQTFTIEVTKAHPYLSLVSMIAPSPDWVVGLSNLKLYSKSAGYYPGVQDMPLYALDGGTENGDVPGNFSINNTATSPKAPINVLLGPGFEAPFAYITIEPVK